jgi:transposase
MNTSHSARQVFDLPEPTPIVVTEHRAHDRRCAACGTHSRARFPSASTRPCNMALRLPPS